MTTRRAVLALFAASAVAAPFATRAQQSAKLRRIGILSPMPQSDALLSDRFGAFVARLRELGYREGQDIAIEWRFADARFERLPALAAELVSAKVDVIVTFGTPGVRAARQATSSVPIVTASFGDPVGSGFATSLSRPGGNVTGLATRGEVVYKKRLELLLTVTPKAARIAWLINPDNAFLPRMLPVLRELAQKSGREIIALRARDAGELQDGLSGLGQSGAGALMVADDSFLNAQGPRIAELALSQRVPSIFPVRESVEAGGLLGYVPDLTAQFRRTAAYVDKILKGARAGDLPIEQADKFELLVNLSTAKALGLIIPQTILVRSDRLIGSAANQ